MKNTYTQKNGSFNSRDFDEERLYKMAEKTMFHVGQSYADEPVPMFKCRICGGIEFNVGSAEYFTAIRCPKCGWESLIHDG